ncbi:glycerophosphodiester phosphodiesterase family protein [Roseobacter sp. N2S]|uniref:glycerophosphodiester phosphodiesterase family protein n=1 Tax=Roseobacter sp. N2S TaxID=2663844 RepID=UPI002857B781|nr:glycerophosphodiester phosphodiesterase family protein [Roseobacter sp. N2S]MDR6263577.1 glycerophosphoryl diester phosphodiesterase [Roseobacter sp. N2S]
MLDAFLKTPLAHRTLHDVRAGRPENSLIGTRAAIEAGYGIEVDLQLSSDGVPMVFHDDYLQRLTRHFGPVREHTAAELGAMRLTHGDECIPTFAALLDLVAGRVPVLVEIKDQDGALGPNTGDMEQAACDVLAGYQGPLALMSFNPHSIAKCAEFAPDVPRGLVTDPFWAADWPDVPAERLAELARIPDYGRIGATFISHNVKDLHSPVVADLVAQGCKLLCWTVRSPEVEAEARKLAQNITFEGYLA